MARDEAQETRKREFEALLMPCLNRLYAVALRFTRNKEVAEDLVADTTLKAWKKFSQLNDRGHFKAWLLKICTHHYLSDYRKRKVRPSFVPLEQTRESAKATENFSLYEELADPLPYAAQHPEKMFLNRVLAKDLQHSIANLPEPYRLVFTLYELEGLDYRAVAASVHCTVGTVRSRLHRARSILQRRLWEHAKEAGIIDG